VYKVSTSGGSPILLTGFTSARTQNPMYSPDGRNIAYLAMDRPGKESDKLHLVLYDRLTGTTSAPAMQWVTLLTYNISVYLCD
jgi:Tol biopolymer transport system component